MKAGDVPKFKMQGVEQCWHCKHRDGSDVHPVNGYLYRLPYCKVCDADMTIIYEPPCRGFEAEEVEA